MQEITTGCWHWNAPHPDWTPDELWDQAVSSYAIDDGERVLLFDPIDPPAEILDLTTNRNARPSFSPHRGTNATHNGWWSCYRCQCTRHLPTPQWTSWKSTIFQPNEQETGVPISPG